MARSSPRTHGTLDALSRNLRHRRQARAARAARGHGCTPRELFRLRDDLPIEFCPVAMALPGLIATRCAIRELEPKRLPSSSAMRHRCVS